jgi:hypothetical protein
LHAFTVCPIRATCSVTSWHQFIRLPNHPS